MAAVQPGRATGVEEGMTRAWCIFNPASGSVSEQRRDAALALLSANATIAGRTDFPTEPLPSLTQLAGAGVDTVVVLAGDGTINAVVRALADWDRGVLILPGGTMNLLAKRLHGDVDDAAIIARAPHAPRVALATIEAAGEGAVVGVILGPATSWNRARERWRAGRWRGWWRAMVHAARRSLRQGVRLDALPARAQAIFIATAGEGMLSARAIEARDAGRIARLGWEWLTGDWMAAPAVTVVERACFHIVGRRPAAALFDGEPALLSPGTAITAGSTRRMFLQTRELSA